MTKRPRDGPVRGVLGWARNMGWPSKSEHEGNRILFRKSMHGVHRRLPFQMYYSTTFGVRSLFSSSVGLEICSTYPDISLQ